MNLTTVTSQNFVDLLANPAKGTKQGFRVIDSYFHPFNGPLAQYGVAVPLAYFLWALNAVPSWAMMIFVSFFSRHFM